MEALRIQTVGQTFGLSTHQQTCPKNLTPHNTNNKYSSSLHSWSWKIFRLMGRVVFPCGGFRVAELPTCLTNCHTMLHNKEKINPVTLHFISNLPGIVPRSGAIIQNISCQRRMISLQCWSLAVLETSKREK